MDLEVAFRAQAAACGRLGSPMYADLLARVADDVLHAGASRAVLAGHEDAPGLALRLAGSVHRLVLERRAGALATLYPSVGGTWESEAGWAAFNDLLVEQPEAVREWLDRPPRADDVGRATALMGGLLSLEDHLPVRLFEIGSCGGLSLVVDRFRYVIDDGRAVGPPDSPVVLDPAWTGPVPLDTQWPRIVARLGSDPWPVDVASTAGRLALTAYVWPDQHHSHERLRGALQLAQHERVVVRRQGAAEFVEDVELADDTVTVLWHGATSQYLDRAEQDAVRARIDALGAAATARRRFAYLALEPTGRAPGADHDFWVALQTWPTGRRRLLGRSHGHGVPTAWGS